MNREEIGDTPSTVTPIGCSKARSSLARITLYEIEIISYIIAMGTWGTELFESDAACDVRDAFATLIPSGTSVEGCVGHVIGRHLAGRRSRSDDGDGMELDWLAQEADVDTVLALAWCVQEWRMRQPGTGPLMRAVLSRAGQISAQETGLGEWPAGSRAARRRVYAQVAHRLGHQ